MAATFVQWIDHQSWFHSCVRLLRLRSLASLSLRIFPISRTYPSGTRIEIADLESFFLTDEIFSRQTYRLALELTGDVRTIVDLGCNAGFFCCYLHEYFKSDSFKGLGIDANPAVLKRARRNLDLNGLKDIKLIQGMVGESEATSTHDFFVYASHLGSSQFLQPEEGRKVKGGWTKISASVVRASHLWKIQYGETSIDLLKIDIEGSEANLLRTDPDLFRNTRCVILEWHKWLVKEEAIFPVLEKMGFARRKSLETGKTAELWFFARS